MIFGNQTNGVDVWTAQNEMHGSKFAFSGIGNANSITVYIGAVTSTSSIKFLYNKLTTKLWQHLQNSNQWGWQWQNKNIT